MKGERFEALDAWRGICALIVALEHLNIDNAIVQNGLIRHGARFVDFFFVLSGFVIAHAYKEPLQKRPGEARRFMLRRIGRLWPLHVSILAVLVVIELGLLLLSNTGISLGREAFSERNTIETIHYSIFLIHSWGILDQLTWNTPSWSISVEFFAYALFGTICVVFARGTQLVTIVILVGSAVGLATVAPIGMQSTYDFGLLRCLFGFMSGVLVRDLWSLWKPRVGTLGEVAISIVVFAGVVLLPTGMSAMLVTPLFTVAVLAFAGESGAVSSLFRRRWLQALGAWSYSIYMVHLVIALGLLVAAMVATTRGFEVFARVDGIVMIVGPTWFTTLVIAGYVFVVLASASLTYRFIELPGQRMFRCLSGSPP